MIAYQLIPAKNLLTLVRKVIKLIFKTNQTWFKKFIKM